jgi:hypothetical protein
LFALMNSAPAELLHPLYRCSASAILADFRPLNAR